MLARNSAGPCRLQNRPFAVVKVVGSRKRIERIIDGRLHSAAQDIVAKLAAVSWAFGGGAAGFGQMSVVQVAVVHSLIIANFVLTAVVNRLIMRVRAILIVLIVRVGIVNVCVDRGLLRLVVVLE